jgi:hypothetical protein
MGLHESRVEPVIAVSDLERAGACYGEALGLGPGEPAGGSVRWTCGEGTRVFVHLSDECGVSDAGRFRAAWAKDPDGNTLAITEVPD